MTFTGLLLAAVDPPDLLSLKCWMRCKQRWRWPPLIVLTGNRPALLVAGALSCPAVRGTAAGEHSDAECSAARAVMSEWCGLLKPQWAAGIPRL
jgi:hypothetical protein